MISVARDDFEGDQNDSAWRKSWRDSLSDSSEHWIERDEGCFLHQLLSTPCLDLVERAEGAWIEIAGGQRILDFHGNSLHQLGYAHPRIMDAMRKQLQELTFCPRRFTNRNAVLLAEKFQTLSNHLLSRTLLMPSGSAAVSAGIRLARITTGKSKVVSWWDSFHGATFDNCALGGERMFQQGAEHLSNGRIHIAPPSRESPFGLADPEVLDYLARKEGDIGVFIAEPVRHVGVLIPPTGYWDAIRRICDRHGILLFFDEIPCGLGRLGHMFAYQYAGVEPDMVALGKGLGGGIFPQAALLCRENLNTVSHSSIGHFTHEKSPIGAACALAVLNTIEDENLCKRAQIIGETISNAFTQKMHSEIREVRHAGALIGIEMDTAERAEQVLWHSLKNGLSFKIGAARTLTLNPPLITTDDEIQSAVRILQAAIS